MSEQVVISVLGTPAPKGSPRVIVRGPGGVPLKSPRVIKDGPGTEAWHSIVAYTAQRAMVGMVPFVGVALRVSVIFRLRRPQGHYGKKGLRRSAPPYPSVKPDLDKLVRATMDPLEGVVFDGDSRIVDTLARKRYAELGEPEGAELVIARMEEPEERGCT
jgi:crossover junction endodeoxyribonuclease RusA